MKQFNIDMLDKKMPQSVPEGYFSRLEEEIFAKVKAEAEAGIGAKTVELSTTRSLGSRSIILTTVIRSTIAVAASVSIALVVYNILNYKQPAQSELNYQEAFNMMSNNDREEILYAYQNDVFLQ